ncbi:MAG: phosphatase [Lachnospiraceae bacterium]|nr:phosphatase [Lachnospiraceae bacterium]
MRDVIDMHTHTIASGHAYNTINEMIEAAQKKNLEMFAITEHGPRVNGSCTEMYFLNLKVMPREKDGMTVLYGVELNILDEAGHVDMTEPLLTQMDIGIAGIHPVCYQKNDKAGNTKAYLNTMKNPYVNIISHPDDARFPMEYKELVPGAKEYHVLLEVNNASLSPKGFRGDPREFYYEMLELCKKYQVPIIVNSDAHVDAWVGFHDYALQLLEEIDFPEELVANARPEILKEYLNCYIHQKSSEVSLL